MSKLFGIEISNIPNDESNIIEAQINHKCNNLLLVANMHCKYQYEKFRIESFKNWPIPWIDVRELAKNGFYYTGNDDSVDCYFCQIRIHDWQAEDTPKEVHKKWAPYCPFSNGNPVDNIPLYKKKLTTI